MNFVVVALNLPVAHRSSLRLGVLLRLRGGFDRRLGCGQEGVALEGCHEDLELETILGIRNYQK